MTLEQLKELDGQITERLTELNSTVAAALEKVSEAVEVSEILEVNKSKKAARTEIDMLSARQKDIQFVLAALDDTTEGETEVESETETAEETEVKAEDDAATETEGTVETETTTEAASEETIETESEGGHYYLELADKEEDTDKVIASCKATIWRDCK